MQHAISKTALRALVLIFTSSYIVPTSGQVPYYYNTSGGFTDTCNALYCQTCSVGQWRRNCGDNIPGDCTSCTNMFHGSVYTSHGYFNNSCMFDCEFGYEKQGTTCWVSNVKLTSNVQVSLPTTQTDFNSKKGFFIQAYATAAGCGTCADTNANPAICGVCKLTITSISGTARRLLQGSIVVSVTMEVVGPVTQQAQLAAKATPPQIAALNTQLNSASIPAANGVAQIGSTTSAPQPPSVPPDLPNVTTSTPSAITTSTSRAQTSTTTTTTSATSTTRLPTSSTTARAQTSTTAIATTTTAASVLTTERRSITGTPSATSSDSTSESSVSIGLIAGAAGGGVVFIGLIGFAIYMLMKTPTEETVAAAPASLTNNPAKGPKGKASLLYYDATKKKPALRIAMSIPTNRASSGGHGQGGHIINVYR